jgi:hypothetical protein
MPVAYQLYGLRVLADSPIPALLPTDAPGDIDLRIYLNTMPPWWEQGPRPGDSVWYSGPHLTVRKLEKAGWYHLVYADQTEFAVNPDGEVWSSWPARASLEDTATYLIGPVMGFILRLRKTCCLHASGVVIGRKMIALAGAPGAGKSTTAAAFAGMGYTVVSDDIVALFERDSEVWAASGYPRLCLWPDAVGGLYGSPRHLPRITPPGGEQDWWDKRYLDLQSRGQFQTGPLPVAAIYLLGPRSADGPKLEAMPGVAAVAALAAHTYMNYLLSPELRADEFRFLSRLVSRVPIRRVIARDDHAQINRLCEAIQEDCAGL